MNRQIDIHELFQEKVRREETRLAVYDSILEKVHNRIKMVARHDGGYTFSFYVLPEVMIGQPLFNADQCRSFVVTSLVKNGFRVKYFHPNLLMISWAHMAPEYETSRKVIEEEQTQLITQTRLKKHEEEKEMTARIEQRQIEYERMLQSQLQAQLEEARKKRKMVQGEFMKDPEEYVPSQTLRNIYFNKTKRT
jgi:hypothetical protein